MAASITDITDPEKLLETFCSPSTNYAWPLYDEDASPGTLTGADLTSPALVGYPIKMQCLNEMGREGTPYAELFARMQQFVSTPIASAFSDIDQSTVEAISNRKVSESIQGPEDWQALIRCFDAVAACKDITSVAVTKILHRKRPELVPINDSRLRNFYGIKSRGYDKLFAAIHHDLDRPDTRSLLSSLISNRSTPRGRAMTDLRALDIVVWMHMGGDRRTTLSDSEG
jgi:hypothetical protein